MNSIKIFSPATVANLSCGYDVLGLCLDSVGDEMIITKIEKKGIVISDIQGYSLPYDSNMNAAGASAFAMLADLDIDFGFDISIKKMIKPGSGIGSSASSSAGSVWAINQLLDEPCTNLQLINYARIGEQVACGAPIADNVSTAIMGGFTLVKSTEPLQVISLPTPKDLYVVILHPQIEIRTEDARAILPINIPLNLAVRQWANIGSLVSALYTDNYDLLSSSLHDVIVEPYRSKLIPYFDDLKRVALENGALGFGISGSGPSVFSICKGKDNAEKVASRLSLFYSTCLIEFKVYVSSINVDGIKIL